jgi:hypothetical protein
MKAAGEHSWEGGAKEDGEPRWPDCLKHELAFRGAKQFAAALAL